MVNKEKIEKALEFDVEKAKTKIIDFIQDRVDEAGAQGVVLGLSGGIDSALTAALCSKSLGDNVLAIFMPEEGVTDPQDYEDVQELSQEFGIRLKEIEISSIFEKMKEEIEPEKKSRMADANLKVRIRMILLYYHANLLNYLVVGTNNKSELKCGYFTKYGDGAADISPAVSLYKTQVKELAREIGVPQNIIDKEPTAGLWEGQTDESELGLPYPKIDRIYAGLEIGLNPEEISKAIDVSKEEVQEFIELEKSTRHKVVDIPSPSL